MSNQSLISLISSKEDSKGHTNEGISLKLSAPGKIILFGEHSVVYNKLAIAASLDLRTKLTFNEIINDDCYDSYIILDFKSINSKFKFNLQDIKENLLNSALPLLINPFDYNFTKTNLLNYESIKSLIENFLKKQNNLELNDNTKYHSLLSFFYLFIGYFINIVNEINLKSFQLSIETELTVSAGTGSSASYSVVLSALFLQLIKLKIFQRNYQKKIEIIDLNNFEKFNEDELNLISNWAFNSEKIIHGTPSGIDNSICTFGGLIKFSKLTKLKLIKLKNEQLKLLLINTRIARDTKLLVKKVENSYESHMYLIGNIFNSMDILANSAFDYLIKIDENNSNRELINENYKRIEELVDINQKLLSALGVSHVKLDEICQMLIEDGLHGKLTGAGGGGYAICFIPPYINELVINKTIRNLNDKNFDAVLVGLGGDGVRID